MTLHDLAYFWIFLKASLFSTGGTGNLPSLHSDLIAHGWAVDRQFGEALAIGQVSPGPTGLWAVALGYLTCGYTGAYLSIAAIAMPPLLVLGVERLYGRVRHHPVVEGFVRGLGLAVVGLSFVILLRLLVGVGIDMRSVVIVIAAIAMALSKRVPVAAILAIAGLVRVVWT